MTARHTPSREVVRTRIISPRQLEGLTATGHIEGRELARRDPHSAADRTVTRLFGKGCYIVPGPGMGTVYNFDEQTVLHRAEVRDSMGYVVGIVDTVSPLMIDR